MSPIKTSKMSIISQNLLMIDGDIYTCEP